MRIFAVLALCLSTAFAATKPTYQDAVLKSFHSSSDGATCGGTTTVDSNSNSAHTRTSCADTVHAYYTIAVGDQLLTVTPAMSGKQSAGAMLSLGYSAVFAKKSSLYGVLPNTPIQIRQDESGKYFVKVGKRESLYKLSSAE